MSLPGQREGQIWISPLEVLQRDLLSPQLLDKVFWEFWRCQLVLHAEGLLVALVIRVRLQAVMVAVTIQLLP